MFVTAGTRTVSTALVLTMPLGTTSLVTATRYKEPEKPAVTLLSVKVDPVSPAISTLLDFHWYVTLPGLDTVVEKTTFWPVYTVWLTGWVMNDGGTGAALISTLATELVTDNP